MTSGPARCAIVTGAARGIGRAAAIQLGREGYGVAIVDINEDGATETAALLRTIPACPKPVVLLADVSKPAEVQRACQRATDTLGAIDVLVNNAAIGGPFHSIDQVSDEEWDWIFATNVKSVFAFARTLLPGMKARGHGRIINIASIQGMVGAELSSTYVATKHAVIGYTRNIATEWGRFGITCNAICPGYVHTNMGAQDRAVDDHTSKILRRTPTASIAKPEEIARWVVFLASRGNSYANGGVFVVDGGIVSSLGMS